MEEKLIKYPRTPHLPWSESKSNNDKVLDTTEYFEGMYTTMSLKMDGENTTMYREHIHARSIDSKNHESRHFVKSIWSNIKHDIPIGWRICGENLYAKHSIYYENLESYFLVFSIWNEDNICLSIEDTIYICEYLGLYLVPIIFKREKFNIELIRSLFNDCKEHEGYVIRNSNEFEFKNFNENVAKYVRKNHIQTSKHWMYSKIIKNRTRS